MTEEGQMQDERRVDMSEAEFRALFQAVCNWGRWGEADERGALNELTADRITAAARLVRTGETVSLSLPLNTQAGLENPEPAIHSMTLSHDVDIGSGTVRLAKDFIGVDYHNDSHSHIDALCHVAFDGALYNGRLSASFDAQGATVNTIEAVKDGLVGRGVLLDVPGLRGVSWLEPGDHVFPDELEAAIHGASPSRERGRLQRQKRACIRAPHVSLRSVASRRSVRTATATRRRARPRESPFPFTR
jgi:hypothetical protein